MGSSIFRFPFSFRLDEKIMQVCHWVMPGNFTWSTP